MDGWATKSISSLCGRLVFHLYGVWGGIKAFLSSVIGTDLLGGGLSSDNIFTSVQSVRQKSKSHPTWG